MQNRKVQFVIVTLLLVAVGLLLIPSMIRANPVGTPSWKSPNANPNCCIEQRDGYSKTFIIDANSVLIEVPEGECFVLLRLYSQILIYDSDDYPHGESVWTLTVDGDIFLNEFGLYDPLLLGDLARYTYTTGLYKGDFPDRCVVVRSGQALEVMKHEKAEKISMTLIGYFCDMP